MILPRLVPVVLMFSVAVCRGQLPPSVLQPGKPANAVPQAVIKSLPTGTSTVAPARLSAAEVAQGWRLLFDGQRLYGMRGVQHSDPLSAGWKISGGQLALPKEVKVMDQMTGGDLITVDPYWDFEFHFEWKSTVSADSGIRYMLIETSGQTPAGLEYQIIDDVHNTKGLKGGALRRTGALDNLLPVGANAKLRSADPLNNVGDPWNEGRIVVKGTHVEHWLNGDKVLEFELGPQLRRLAEANKMPVPVGFGMKNRTRICLLDQGTEIAFRNLKIRSLTPGAGARTGQPGGTAPNPLLLPSGSGAR